MSIEVGDILRVVAILAWLDGDIAQSVFNASIGGAAGPYDEEDIVDDAVEWAGDIYDTVAIDLSDEIDGSEVRVYIYDSVDDDWDEIGSAAWAYDPTATAEQLPRGVAGLINSKTIDPDVNGKKYVPGLTEAASTDGLLSATVVTRLGLFGAEWVTPFTGGTSTAPWVPVIWSPTKTTPYLCTGTILVPSIPAYQRRRKNGIGI